MYYYITIKIKINNSRLLINKECRRRKKMSKSKNFKKKVGIEDKKGNKRNLIIFLIIILFNIQPNTQRITTRKSIRFLKEG